MKSKLNRYDNWSGGIQRVLGLVPISATYRETGKNTSQYIENSQLKTGVESTPEGLCIRYA
jgi:hypothetical protein